MRKLIVLAPGLLMLGACVSTANIPPKVSWSYGAGNGDGVQYPGPPPKYSFGYGSDNGVSVTSGGAPTTAYSYGGDGTTGDMVQMVAPERQQVAQPAAAPNRNTHS